MSQASKLDIDIQALKNAKVVQKLWGFEFWMENNTLYCAKILILDYGFQSSLHFHEYKDEMFLVLHGRVFLEIADRSTGRRRVMEMAAGDKHRLFPRVPHRFWAAPEGATILEVSTRHSDDDVIRLEESKVRNVSADATNGSAPPAP
jgi:D-lyxose ketol-isomerase